MEIKFVVTILHNKEIVDWTWDSDPNSENYGEEYPVYEDDPFYAVEMFVDGRSHVITRLPEWARTEDVEYEVYTSIKEVARFFDQDDDILRLLWFVVETLGL